MISVNGCLVSLVLKQFLLPGKFELKATLPAPAKAGTYQLGFGIEDPWKKRPAIRLANDLLVKEGWTVLGQVEVKSKLK